MDEAYVATATKTDVASPVQYFNASSGIGCVSLHKLIAATFERSFELLPVARMHPLTMKF